jgi:hypothetical protein
MHSFEDVRAHIAAHYETRDNEPYLISLELALGEGRYQGMYLAELDSEQGRKYLRVSTPVAPLGHHDALRCLRFNWEQRVGYLAVSDLDGVAYLHLCENRPYHQLTAKELDAVLVELGTLADRLEQLMGKGKDLL